MKLLHVLTFLVPLSVTSMHLSTSSFLRVECGGSESRGWKAWEGQTEKVKSEQMYKVGVGMEWA